MKGPRIRQKGRPRAMAEDRRAFVEKLFAKHRVALQAFFYRRIRTKPDAADLAQEVYLRMLRVPDTDAIRNPEAYLYTVAANLLKENAVADRRLTVRIDADTNSPEPPEDWPAVDSALDASRRIERLAVVLRQLTPKCRAAVILQYRYELSYQEIAERLEVSTHMVKKYLAQALTHCRLRMARLG
jgi:RNA polymerase sigma factor (sigma-70 family)